MGERLAYFQDMINADPNLVAIVMAFLDDITISRGFAGVPARYKFQVFDPEIGNTLAGVWEEHWRVAEEDDWTGVGLPCQLCGLDGLHLYQRSVGYITLVLHRELTHLPQTERVVDFIGDNMLFETRDMCYECSCLLMWSDRIVVNLLAN